MRYHAPQIPNLTTPYIPGPCQPGSIVASGQPNIIKAIAAAYPGRASAAPIVDLFITLLTMGRNTYRMLLDERVQLLMYFQVLSVPLTLPQGTCLGT